MTGPFASWTEIDEAIHLLGVAVGLLPADWRKARSIVETNNATTRGLTDALLALVAQGALEATFTATAEGWQMKTEASDDDFAFRRPHVQ